MKQLIKRLSRVADSSSTSTSTSYTLLRSDSASARNPRRRTVRPGHVPVYVGQDMDRFVVSANIMNHPLFVMLLNKSAQEYGYEQKGALRIPCTVVVFEEILRVISCGGRVSDDALEFIDDLLFV